MGSLFTSNSYGWGGWGQTDLFQQVQHYRQWSYTAIHAICKKVGSLMPNFAYVSSHERPGHTVKGCQRGLMNLYGGKFGGSYAVEGNGHSFLTVGEYRSKALSVIKDHEHIEPLEHDHPLRRLWSNPNPYDTSFQFQYELCMFHHLCGSAYPWMVPNSLPDPKPAELWVMPSHWVWPRTGGGNIAGVEGGNGNAAFNSTIGKEWWKDSDRIIKYYEVRPWGTTGTAGMLKIPPSDMCMVKWKSPLDKVRGYSPLGAIAQWIDSEESITKSRWSQFQNIARPDLFIKLGIPFADMTDDTIERLSAKVDQKLRGEYNYGRTIFGSSDMEVTPLSWNPTEMAYKDSEADIRDMILSALGVPKAWVGIVNEMTFGSILATLMQACEGCLNPYLAMLGQEMTKHLASRWDEETPAWSSRTEGGAGTERYVKMWWDNCTPADPAQVNSDIATDLQAKAITPNMVLAMRGRPPYKHGGDDPMGSAGDVPIPLNSGDDLEDLASLMKPMLDPKTTVSGTEALAGEGLEDSGKPADQAGGTKPSPSMDDKTAEAEAEEGMIDGGKIDKPNGKPSKGWKFDPNAGYILEPPVKDMDGTWSCVIADKNDKLIYRVEGYPTPQLAKQSAQKWIDTKGRSSGIPDPNSPRISVMRSWSSLEDGGEFLEPTELDEHEEIDKCIGDTVQAAGQWLANRWANLEQRYGRKGALAMAVGMIATSPLPGNIAVVIAAAEAIRGIHGVLTSKDLEQAIYKGIVRRKSAARVVVKKEVKQPTYNEIKKQVELMLEEPK